MGKTADSPRAMESLETQLGYTFTDRELLRKALTHRSRRGEEGQEETFYNERLEFLGDAIVGFLLSDSLFALLPTSSEGKLSRIKSNLVNAENLRRVADRLELGQYLQLGPGEEKTGGRQKPALLANAVEALVAALYLDGGMSVARRFVDVYLVRELKRQGADWLARADFKSTVQEFLQARHRPPAQYKVIESSGPDHAKVFLVELWQDGRRVSRGRGGSKKAAEQEAARGACDVLKIVASPQALEEG